MNRAQTSLSQDSSPFNYFLFLIEKRSCHKGQKGSTLPPANDSFCGDKMLPSSARQGGLGSRLVSCRAWFAGWWPFCGEGARCKARALCWCECEWACQARRTRWRCRVRRARTWRWHRSPSPNRWPWPWRQRQAGRLPGRPAVVEGGSSGGFCYSAGHFLHLAAGGAGTGFGCLGLGFGSGSGGGSLGTGLSHQKQRQCEGEYGTEHSWKKNR